VKSGAGSPTVGRMLEAYGMKFREPGLPSSNERVS
jgi:hypothetical protein